MKTYTALYTSPLGQLKIECSEEHVMAVVFVNDVDAVSQEDEHPLLGYCKEQLQEYFSGSRKTFHLPLQQTGTIFQQKVWELLVQIPFGKTISYHALSKQYGDPKAIRAVASANGKNNLAVIVPCHRVIGSNQSLTGYAGGLWRKRWLLAHEAKHHSGVMTLF
jgi:methylated-DNA-[protein]-cysteine S-methyltransferase